MGRTAAISLFAHLDDTFFRLCFALNAPPIPAGESEGSHEVRAEDFQRCAFPVDVS